MAIHALHLIYWLYSRGKQFHPIYSHTSNSLRNMSVALVLITFSNTFNHLIGAFLKYINASYLRSGSTESQGVEERLCFQNCSAR